MTQVLNSNFHFSILGKTEVKKRIKTIIPTPTHLLSINDRNDRTFRPSRILPENHLQLIFTDEEGLDHPEGPTEEHIVRLLEWGNNLPEDASIIVNCQAGRRRSSAAAFLILAQRFGIENAEAIFQQILENRPIARPNLLMMRYGDEILNANGVLFNITREHAISVARGDRDMFL